MGKRTRIASVVGARPQFVKLAPIIRAAAGRDGVAHRVIHTGQHYDQNMSASFFEQLEMPAPDLDLGVGSGSHAAQTAAMLARLEEDFLDYRPDAVLVYGDTNSTLAATLAASKIHVPVAHVEAGLRSYNRKMPEEINRLVADHCGDRLYAPTPVAMRNLAAENLSGRAVFSGDVMYDAVLHNIELARRSSNVLEALSLSSGGFGLVTVHRPVNTDPEPLQSLLGQLQRVARDQLPLVFPVHPRTRAVIEQIGFRPEGGLQLVEPQPYLDNIRLIEAAAVVITDSGGMQKEAAFLETPCLTMRNETEWVETVEIGVNRLVGDAATGLADSIAEMLQARGIFDEATRRQLRECYGEGNAAGFIVDDCLAWVSANTRKEE
mgnify:CR=1 FL=1